MIFYQNKFYFERADEANAECICTHVYDQMVSVTFQLAFVH